MNQNEFPRRAGLARLKRIPPGSGVPVLLFVFIAGSFCHLFPSTKIRHFPHIIKHLQEAMYEVQAGRMSTARAPQLVLHISISYTGESAGASGIDSPAAAISIERRLA